MTDLGLLNIPFRFERPQQKTRGLGFFIPGSRVVCYAVVCFKCFCLYEMADECLAVSVEEVDDWYFNHSVASWTLFH